MGNLTPMVPSPGPGVVPRLAERLLVLEPLGPRRTFSLRRGRKVLVGSPPAYSASAAWRTWFDPAEGRGPFLFRAVTADSPEEEVATTPFDIAGLGGVDVEVVMVPVWPAPTATTQVFVAAQDRTNTDYGPASPTDFALGVVRGDPQPAFTLQFSWVDSDDADHEVLFAPVGFFAAWFDTDLPARALNVRAQVRDNNNGTADAKAWVRLDPEGPWLPLVISSASDGASVDGSTVGIDPKFATRDVGFATGACRSFTYRTVLREPSVDPIGSPGDIVFNVDPAEAIGKGPGDTWTGGDGATYTFGAHCNGAALDPDRSGWMMYAGGSGYTDQTIAHSADIDLGAGNGSWSAICAFTPTPGATEAYYVQKCPTVLGSPGVLIANITAFGYGHTVVVDATASAGDFNIDLSVGDRHDLAVVVDGTARTMTVYVDGVARTPVDISAAGDYGNSAPLRFSGGVNNATATHAWAHELGVAWTAADVAAVRDHLALT